MPPTRRAAAPGGDAEVEVRDEPPVPPDVIQQAVPAAGVIEACGVVEQPGGAREKDFAPCGEAGASERVQVGVVLDPEPDALTVFREKRLLAASEAQQGTEPALPAADHVKHALADAEVPGAGTEGEVLLQLRLQPGEVSAEGQLVDRGAHGILLGCLAG